MHFNLGSIQLTGFPALVVFLTVSFVAYGWPAMIISRRAHGSAWPGAIMAIPVINIIAIWVFAFSRWPKSDGAEKK